MLSKVCSAAVNGIDAYPGEVEVNEGFGDAVNVIKGFPERRDLIESSGCARNYSWWDRARS